MSKEAQIIAEINEKASDYEGRMADFMTDVGEWGDMFKVKPPARKQNTFSNPRQTEFFRACNAVGTLMYRMMTAADPFFSLQPVQMNVDYDDLDTLTHVFKTQLKYARYRPNLLRACLFTNVFGTVIAQEDYRVVGVSVFGRRIPVTTMIPRVLDQVMFDRGTTDIAEADWVATADITSSSDLMRLGLEADSIGTPWNKKALEAAAKNKEENNTINQYVMNRLRRAGFSSDDDALLKKKELLMYYGKLDTMNDGIEYVCALVNRKFLVRFHANNFQHGRRPFRVAKYVDFDTALGYGQGQLLANHHRAMDANRQKAQDLFSFGAYNMWTRVKDSVINEDLVIRPLEVVDVDNQNALQPLSPNLQAGEAILKLDEILKQEFRTASGASDTLQAIATDATATAANLAQTEALRNIAVKAELAADSLVREHLENIHANNVQNIREPFNINKSGIAKRIYPMHLQMDVEIEAKVTTDRDFQPQRLEKLISTLQILTSTKSNHPDQMQISVLPLVRQIAYMLEVNPNEVIMRPDAAPMPGQMGSGDMAGLAAMMTPGAGGPGGALGVGSTPVGPVLTAP